MSHDSSTRVDLRRARGLYLQVCIALVVTALAFAWSPDAEADGVKLDGTFGTQGWIDPVNGEYQILDTMGAYSNGGRNLFHSFTFFDIDSGSAAVFSASGTPDNVIARVTGDSESVIDGTLKSTIDGANLFFLNPAGIQIGQNAKIDVKGSVHLSTADVLRFPGGNEYPATGPLSHDPLVIVTDPASFGFSGDNSLPPDKGFISVNRTFDLLADDPGKDWENATLSIIGGDAQVLGRASGAMNVDVRSGRLQIAATCRSAGNCTPVDIPVDLDQLDMDSVQPGQLGLVNILDNASLEAGSLSHPGSAGGIVIRGERFLLRGSKLGSLHYTNGVDSSGDIDVAVTNDLVVTDSVSSTGSVYRSNIVAEAYGDDARVGDIRLRGESVDIDKRSRVTTSTRAPSAIDGTVGRGIGGDIRIEADRVRVDSRAIVRILGNGELPGDIVISGRGTAPQGELPLADSIEVSGGAKIRSTSRLGIGGGIEIAAVDTQVRGAGTAIWSESERASVEGGPIVIRGEGFFLSDGAKLLSESESGRGGDIDVAASHIELDGYAAEIASVVRSGSTRGGDVFLESDTLAVVNDSRVVTSNQGDAGSVGGNLEIESGSIFVARGGSLVVQTQSAGDAGDLFIRKADTISVEGWDQSPTGIGNNVLSGASGGGGLLHIDARILELDNTGRITISTAGAGDAGDLEIVNAERITIRGGEDGFSSIANQTLGDSSSTATAGDLTIQAGLFELLDGGQIEASTTGLGDAGGVTIRADRLRASGRDPFGNPSGIFSLTLSEAIGGGGGRGGDIDISTTQDIILSDGAQISARSRGAGDAGEIGIHAGQFLELRSGSQILTDAPASNGGAIEIFADERVYLFGSTISTSVLLGQGGGGDILIARSRSEGFWGSQTTEPVEFVVLNNGTIIAQAFAGDGGNITIDAQQLILSVDSLIDATSTLGIDGELNYDSPEDKVLNELARLNATFLDAESLLTSPCAARTAREGSFVVSRRNVPPPPDAPLSYFDSLDLEGGVNDLSRCPTE